MPRVHIAIPSAVVALQAAGLAFDLHNILDMSLRTEVGQSLGVRGEEDEQVISQIAGQVTQGIMAILRDLDQPAPNLNIVCEPRIPYGVGLGATETWIVGAMVALNNLLGMPLPRQRVVELIAQQTALPIGGLASLFGSLTTAQLTTRPLLHHRLECTPFKVVVAATAHTTDASTPSATANTVILADALRRGDLGLLARLSETLHATDDAIVKAATANGATAVLSASAGCVWLAFTATAHKQVERAWLDHFAHQPVATYIFTTTLDTQGVVLSVLG